MKMDIDGHEAKAIEGMQDTIKLKKIQHLQLELDPFLWKESGSHDKEYGLKQMDLFLDAGYKIYILPDPKFPESDNAKYGVTPCILPDMGKGVYRVQKLPKEHSKQWLMDLPGRYPGIKNANLYLTLNRISC